MTKSQKLTAAQKAHADWVTSMLKTTLPKIAHTSGPRKPYSDEPPQPFKSITQAIQPIALKRNILDVAEMEEKTEIRNAIRDKARRVAPLVNKGALQYITEGTDLTTLGKK